MTQPSLPEIDVNPYTQAILVFDPIDGLFLMKDTPENRERVADILLEDVDDISADIESLDVGEGVNRRQYRSDAFCYGVMWEGPETEFKEQNFETKAVTCESCGCVIIPFVHDGVLHSRKRLGKGYEYVREHFGYGCADEWAMNQDAIVCETCASEDDGRGTHIIMAGAEYEKAYIGEFTAYFLDADGGGDSCPNSNEMADFVRGYSCDWVPSDAWRGAYDTKAGSGYTNVACGWTTGDWGDSTSTPKQVFNRALNKLIEDTKEGVEFNFRVFLVVTATSNLFAQGVDLYVPDGDVEEFEKWVVSIGLTIEQLYDALG